MISVWRQREKSRTDRQLRKPEAEQEQDIFGELQLHETVSPEFQDNSPGKIGWLLTLRAVVTWSEESSSMSLPKARPSGTTKVMV